MKKQTTRSLKLRKRKSQEPPIKMLTCYDFQTATLLNETNVDMILVGDSLGNVILGYDTTISVTLQDMILFGTAVKRGAQNKFVVVDMPFGTYAIVNEGVRHGLELFKSTKAEAIKLEGANPVCLEVIKKLTSHGVPIVGHIGLTPQSIHQMGGYYVHGKNTDSASQLIEEAQALEEAGAFSLVLECITPELSSKLSTILNIPTIGIGSGEETDGQVLVINDLLHMGKKEPPRFCQPLINLFELKKELIQKQFKIWNGKPSNHENVTHH